MGKQFIHHLNGDWSVAIFDFKERELFLARDPLGYTSLYYYSRENSFYFSSSIKSLLHLKNYRKQLNELHLIRNLTLWNDNQTLHETYYKNIYSLPPAHTLSVKNKILTLQKYWPDKEYPVIKYKQLQQYVDEMQEIFTCAVKSRVNSSPSVASMLSGGLDSSAVSYIAADLLKEQKNILQLSATYHYLKKRYLLYRKTRTGF
ncbi:asparagine synthase-related protein [Niabella sp. W65]|nr:asparagine synthase-related protein [Niabella sp. W65]MCH7367576.1 asparagine synthase-related protein [Niabella sp. W65]ULT43478.1 asparagine synthase-related protein [Niabella sp. I65]